MFFDRTHVFNTFVYLAVFPLASTPYGFDDELRQSLKLHYFSSTMFPSVLVLPLKKYWFILFVQFTTL